MKTYLIQRAKFQDRENMRGIDSILQYDYMGSSEFEYGALPKSLGNIRMELNDYVYSDMTIGGKAITVFCNESQTENILPYLTELSENRMRLKEFSGFNSYISDSGYFKDRFDFWWDIENDLMFWKKNQQFEAKFRIAIAPQSPDSQTK